jgi:hypothetical protein
MPTWPGYRPPSHRRPEAAGEQVAEPACGLDRPDPLTVVELARPAQQLRDLSRGGPHQPLAKHFLVAVDRDRDVGALVRVDADRDHRDPPIIKQTGRTAVGTPDSRCRAAALFRATQRWNTSGPASRNRKPDPRAGRQFVSNDRQRSTDATSNPATPAPTQSGSSACDVSSRRGRPASGSAMLGDRASTREGGER